MEPDSSEVTGSDLSRRKFVAGSAAGFATVALAGCSGEEEPEPTTTAEPEPEDFVVTDDVIVSSAFVPTNQGFAQACSPSRMFAPKMHPVFKIGVYDPETGEHLTNDDLESVVVNIDGYDSVELAWAGDDEEHPAQEWGASWTIPEDAETGALSYTVEVTDGDANFTNVGILESQITIIEYSDPLDFVITDDLYTGSDGIGDQEGNAFVSSCQPDRQFAPNMMVGFDIGIFDADTGMPISPPDFEWEESMQGPIDSVEIVIDSPDEEAFHTVEAPWAGEAGDHSEKGDSLLYNGVWHMADFDVSPGTYEYTVNVNLTDEASEQYDGKSIGSDNVGGHAYNQFTVVDA
ncbi:twin-arginine translocation signal domain-containing protein [Halodesulfurarchaeum sp.]|uniref:twin-arginine translocation signal domain-containing protein n=1 Tax=Halodesulfurarchaeum sp. TaxID=1980530 RepID=UPI002FC32611